ncbi:MAG TPA: 5-deoxy-glucuronate isomerase [Pirellulales bacterium]|nr:5-deoxy-glucuronate isomerase [Pirellulales bacterium]
MPEALPAHFVAADHGPFRYVERTSPTTSNLSELTCGVYEFSAQARTATVCHPDEEAFLLGWAGKVTVTVGEHEFTLAQYDSLYVPKGAAYRLSCSSAPAKVIVCRAPAKKVHPLHYERWDDLKNNEARIRHLKGKDVFLMFDVTEGGDRLMAGLTIFEPHQRSYPPHNHTDQEEIYFFTQGHGAMEVYADEQTKWFVHSVNTGDLVTIPLLNYHPVFSHEESLHFLWCIAGERYWIGDKNKDFMAGKGEKITT